MSPKTSEYESNLVGTRLKRDCSDFGKWGVRIMVSFRDDVPLEELTGQRQSGGVSALLQI